MCIHFARRFRRLGTRGKFFMLKPSAETLWARRILAADPKFAGLLHAVAPPASSAEAAAASRGGEVIAFTAVPSQARPGQVEVVDAGLGEPATEQTAESPKGTSPSRIA